MRGKKICATVLAAVLCLGLLTGCSTNAGEHISTYFTQMSNVVTTAIEAEQARAAAASGSSDSEDSATSENALATPTNFTVDENGNYSFDAVENAVSYYLYIYEDAQTKDATYSISAEFTWDETYVSNPSYTIDGGTAVTSSEENLISGESYYSSDIFNSFDFPHVYEGFDPEAGGSVGVWYNENTSVSSGWGQEESDTNAYFEATPIEANDGALYSYDIVISSPCGSITATPQTVSGQRQHRVHLRHPGPL